MEHQDSRAFLETQAGKGSQDPQGSWDLGDPKVLWASLAQMDSQALLACLDQLDPLGRGDFQEKF